MSGYEPGDRVNIVGCLESYDDFTGKSGTVVQASGENPPPVHIPVMIDGERSYLFFAESEIAAAFPALGEGA